MNENKENEVLNHENLNTEGLSVSQQIVEENKQNLNGQPMQETSSATNTKTSVVNENISETAGNNFNIDPSSITVGPEVINQQIPVDNQNFVNQPVHNAGNQNIQQSSAVPIKKGNNFSLFLVFLLFLAVGAFIWFMPEIRQMMNNNKKVETNNPMQEDKNKNKNENTTQIENFDSMVCTRVGSTYTLYSSNTALKKYSITTEYTNNIDENYKSCLMLQQSEVNGFLVGCEKTTNRISVVKTFDFTILSDGFTHEDMKFKKDTDIKTIQSGLEKDGYTCG